METNPGTINLVNIDNDVPISDRFFDIFSEYKFIRKLKLELKQTTVLSGSVECFKHCKQLNDIDINYSELREDFFANIASFVPKLQSLLITTNKQYSDSFIDSFKPMKNIQRVKICVTNEFDEIIDTKSQNLTFYLSFG